MANPRNATPNAKLSGLCKPAVLAIRLGQKSPVPVQGGAKGRLGGNAQRRGIPGSFWQSWRVLSRQDEGLWDSNSPGTDNVLSLVFPPRVWPPWRLSRVGNFV
jgi:hypothetical protein